MLLVALTGNYGMGKSTVLSLFRKLGFSTLDADRIVVSLLRKKEILEKIKQLMGDNVFNDNGSLNRKKVAEVIFRKDSLRRSLEDLLHPYVFERIKYFAKKRGKHDNILIIAAPLVYERKYEDKFAKIIVVHTTKETALSRLGIKGVPKKDALLRMKAQLPITKKMKRADFLIDNNGTVKETKLQVEKLYRKLLREAKKWKSSEDSKT